MATSKLSAVVLREVELLESETDIPSLNVGASVSTDGASNRTEISQSILADLKSEMDVVAPWFAAQMPAIYQAIVPPEERKEHLLEIVAAKSLTRGQMSERQDVNKNILTIVSPGESGASFINAAPRIGSTHAKFINMFSSLDMRIAIGSLYLNAYTSEGNWASKELDQKRNTVSKLLGGKLTPDMEAYLAALDSEYVNHATPRMIALGYKAVEYCQSNERSYVHLTTLEDEPSETRFRVDIGIKGFPLTAVIENLVGIFNRYNFAVRRVMGNEVRLGDNQFSLVSVVASNLSNEKITHDMQAWRRVLKALKTLSFVDHGDEFSALLRGTNPMSINETNLIRAMANWAHIFLTNVNPYYYSLDRCSSTLVRQESFREDSIKYFRSRFDPRFKADRTASGADIARKVESALLDVADEVERNIMREGFNFLRNILKTNYFMVSKGALSFRVDPRVLNKTFYPETPYGIFFMIGRNFRAFQVRYRDIARGGVRVVMPRTQADYDNALAGIFDEVNGLAYAQQLKNKDIPEGGSKCVFVVKPGGNRHLAVKSGVSGLLDLIVTDAKTGKLADEMIDYFGQEEIIYLGPDENMTDDLIVWTIQHALHRGYKYAYAFMSSKPDFGINHKTYGVTSEGVNVYLDNVLNFLKLNSPLSTFRVKMTGGPDGDVAGNELKILHRQYGERAKVVAIADGFGAAYDPVGLNWKELLRLVVENRSIAEFNSGALSKDPSAFVIHADTKENIKKRDNLYATVEAEIFIPAGGRPYTVKESNWEKFLLPDGKPSSLAIVEGANIFFTPEARKKLVEAGVIVIKDSSANKAGVICSSYEIIACLTISQDEFAKIKSTYVSQVVDILRTKADQEAKLLFAEWRRRSHDTNLVNLSYEISSEINLAKDIVREKLNQFTDEELVSDDYAGILYRHCPAILVEKYRERILQRLPRAHKIAIMSAYMASHLIYKEGLNWLETMSADQVFKIALEYMKAEKTVETMIAEVGSAKISNKDEIISILRGAGAKHLASTIM